MSQLLQLTDLGRSFGQTTVLAGINLTIDSTERLAVLGSSGSGKSTLLRLIAGLEAPTAGNIAIDGKAASRAGEVLIAPERRGIALVFQGLALFPHLRAFDQIAFAAKGNGGINRARSLLKRVGLAHRANARLDELSGGERQRIALARALAQEPRLLLMDEPFASLDDQKRGEMRQLLRDLIDSTQTPLILVTHSRDDALNLARRVLVLDRGRPVAEGPLSNVMNRPGHAAAARSLGLGQILQGHALSGESTVVMTAFGPVHIAPSPQQGIVHVLIRPAQPRLVSQEEPGSTPVQVTAIELVPSETKPFHRIAVVRSEAGQLLRVLAEDLNPIAGDFAYVHIDGVCEKVEG